MLKNLANIGLLALAICCASAASGQAIPTATAKGALQVGAGWSFASPDYGQREIQGISAFADWDFMRHVGVEAELHQISLITPTDLAENSYLIGPRVIYPRGHFKFYAKGLLGVGNLVIQEQQDNIGRNNGTSFAIAVGGGVDYLATRRLTIRPFDFEYQHWNYLTGLTPTVITIGAAYRFH
jgi:hypothetical protein